MSVQRKPQNRDNLVKAQSPRSQRRDVVSQKLSAIDRVKQELGIDISRRDLHTREGLISSGILREGVCFTTLPRERERRKRQ